MSYEHRRTSSLTPAQVTDQDTYYGYAWMSLVQGMHMLPLVLIHLASYLPLRWFVDRVGDHTGNYTSLIRAKMQSIRDCVDSLLFRIRWVLAHDEIALLCAEDLFIYVRKRHQFHLVNNRRFANISEQDCYRWFSQDHENMCLLVAHLRVPDTFVHPTNGAVYTGEECFVVWLYHMTKGAPFTEMARFVFGGDPHRLSDMNNLFISYAYNAYYNKISGTSLDQWLPNKLNLCHELILSSVASGAIEEIEFEDGQVMDWQWITHHFDIDSFCVFGFLDDFPMPTARPAGSATRTHGFVENIQWAFYSGYLRRHGLKAVLFRLFTSSRPQGASGLPSDRDLSGHFICGLLPCLYCDEIFVIHPTICPRFVNPTPKQAYLNLKFASERQCIEHVFGDHRTRFKLFSVLHYFYLFDNGVKVQKQCLLSSFVLNCYYCLVGTRSGYFGHATPTLEEYLPLDEQLTPHLLFSWEILSIFGYMVHIMYRNIIIYK